MLKKNVKAQTDVIHKHHLSNYIFVILPTNLFTDSEKNVDAFRA